MAKGSVISNSESYVIEPKEGGRPAKDVSFNQYKGGKGGGSPLKGSGMYADVPTSSKPDSWVKGGEKGPFKGPPHSF